MEKKSRTVAKKVTDRLSLAMLCINVIAITIIIIFAKMRVEQTEEKYIGEIVDNITSTLEQTMHEFETSSKLLAENSGIIQILKESNKANPMKNHENMSTVLSELTNVKNNFSGQVEIIAILDLDQDAYIMHDGTISDSSMSMSSRPYYEAITTKSTIVTAPYTHTITNSMVVSVASPVISNGEVLGCVILNIPTSFISELTSTFGTTGTTWAIDGSKNVLAHPTTSYIGGSYTGVGITGSEFVSEISNPSSNLINFELNGVSRVGVLKSIPHLNWVLIGGIDKLEFEDTANSLGWVLIVIQVISVFLALVACSRLIKHTLYPIEELNTSMLEMSKGNLSATPEFESDDEIGELCENLRTTMTNLDIYINEINANLDAFGNGDFTRTSELVFLGDFRAIQTSTEKFVSLISTTLDELKSNVEQVSSSSDFVASGSQNLASGSIQQAESVNVLNHNIENITKSVNENVKNVEYVNDCSIQASNELANSNEKMNEMIKAMGEIQRATESIQNIIKTIEDVAFQTNILALNAAVEAARAGSAGQGFAVVADEVRNLSFRTSTAVKETVKLITESDTAVNTGSTLLEETSKSLSEAIDVVNSYMSTLEQVTNTSKGQAVAIEEINTGVGEITLVTQNNSAISEESAAASEELSSQAEVMKESIDRFKL